MIQIGTTQCRMVRFIDDRDTMQAGILVMISKDQRRAIVCGVTGDEHEVGKLFEVVQESPREYPKFHQALRRLPENGDENWIPTYLQYAEKGKWAR